MTLLGIALLSGAGFGEMFTITLYFGWGHYMTIIGELRKEQRPLAGRKPRKENVRRFEQSQNCLL